MALQFEVDSIEGLDEAVAGLYEKHGDKFRLAVDGIDPADELKEALRKEREERASAKQKLAEIEKQQEESERQRLEKEQEFKSLYEREQESSKKTTQELEDLKRKVADKERSESAMTVVGALTRDTARAELLQDRALKLIHHTPEGIKINGPDGEAWDAERLSEHLAEKYPFLVDGNQASGGGAAGSRAGGGAVTKKFSEYNGAELSQLRKDNPAEYDRIKAAHYGT